MYIAWRKFQKLELEDSKLIETTPRKCFKRTRLLTIENQQDELCKDRNQLTGRNIRNRCSEDSKSESITENEEEKKRKQLLKMSLEEL